MTAITDHDPARRAALLLKRAGQNGKPIRIFLGFRACGGGQHQLVALDARSDITRSLPQSELLVVPTMTAERLAQAIGQSFDGLRAARAAMPAPSCKPKSSHKWRNQTAFRRRQGTP